MATINLNVFDKVLTKALVELESLPDETTAETLILKNIDKDKKIVVPFTGTGRAAKLVNNNPDVFKDKDVKFFDENTGYSKAVREKYNTDVKIIKGINEVQLIKDIDSVIVINEAEKKRDIKQFIKDVLSIPSKKYFIVIPNVVENGSEVGINRVEQVNNTNRKIINNVFSHKAILQLGAEFGFNPFLYKQKDKSIPDCVIFAKQDNTKTETNNIKKEAAEVILKDELPPDLKAKKAKPKNK